MPKGIYNRKDKVRVMKQCKNCGIDFSIFKSWEDKRFTCSKKCGNKILSERVAWNKGMKGFLAGENHYKWKKDRDTLAKRQERNDMAYKEWRRVVWTRDNWKCRIGNKDCNGRLEAHHILGWTAFPELRYDINNGITLCHFHHPHKRSEEVKLSPYFKDLVMNVK